MGAWNVMEWAVGRASEIILVASKAATMNGVKGTGRSHYLRLLCLDDSGGERRMRQSWPRRPTSCLNAKSF